MPTLFQLPQRQDNYSYALLIEKSVIMIDPSEEKASLNFFDENPDYKLKAILNTHHHYDHVSGNKSLLSRFDVPVFGPKLESQLIPGLSHGVSGDEEFDIESLKFVVKDVRAHTRGHVAYWLKTPCTKVFKQSHMGKKFLSEDLCQREILFVGDSLFAAGCGRLFEGSVENLKNALQFYSSVNEDVVMACAHEYTQNNLSFAESLLPDHVEIRDRIENLPKLLKNEGTSVPCLFKDERATNPFLMLFDRSYRTEIAQSLNMDEEKINALVKELRARKDRF